MLCGDALVRRMGRRVFYKMVTDATYYRVVKLLVERLGEGFHILDVRMLDVVTVEAEVVRQRDGKRYTAVLHLDTGTLDLKPHSEEVVQ